MNYRHAFHAGNFADCMKHALLVWLLGALHRKPAPFFVLDTHAGSGRYALDASPAQRTAEARSGILRLLTAAPPALADYLALVRDLGLYPGSPALIRAMLRPQDRLACCELHPEEAAALKALFVGDRQVGVHQRDGYEAVRGLLPPAEKRGLVLIDPPYEQPGEMLRVAAALRLARARFPGATAVAWYPVKHRAPARTLIDALRDMPDVVLAELTLRTPDDPARLNGCGLAVAAPPWRFEAEAPAILDALLAALAGPAGPEPGARAQVVRVSAE
jgi:23S rRNA (adenine2030-N6)-methyltransferase